MKLMGVHRNTGCRCSPFFKSHEQPRIEVLTTERYDELG